MSLTWIEWWENGGDLYEEDDEEKENSQDVETQTHANTKASQEKS